MGKIVLFDDIFKQVGGFGTYQVGLFIVLGLSSFSSVEIIYMNFVGFTPEHWCRVPQLAAFNSSHQKYIAIPTKANVGSTGEIKYDSCHQFSFNYSEYSEEEYARWDRADRLANETPGNVSCMDGWEYDRSIIPKSIVTKWDLVCGNAWLVELVSTIYVLGFMAGSLVIGPVSDRYGRKKGYIIFTICKVVLSYASAFSFNYTMLVVLRFFLAATAMPAYVMSFTLLVEMVGPNYRSAVGVGYAAIYSIGFMTTAFCGYFVRDDTDIQIIMSSVSAACILTFWVIPESPRWLLLAGRGEEAEQVVRNVADVNGRPLDPQFSVKDMIVPGSNGQKQSTMKALIKSKELRKRSAILCLHWFTDNLVYYALSLNAATLSGNIYLNVCFMGAVEIPANITGIIIMNWRKIGRRWTAVLSLLTAGIACLLNVPLIITNASPPAVTVLSLVGKGGATIGFSCMYVYTSELFPTEVRGVGIGLCSFMSRVSGMIAPYAGGTLGQVWAPLPSIIFGVFSIVAGSLSVFLPETLGKRLPDTIQEVANNERTEEVKIRTISGDDHAYDNAEYISEF